MAGNPSAVAPIDTSSRAAVVAAYQSVFVPTKATRLTWNGGSVANCQAGDTPQSYKEAVLRMVNYQRAMAGLPGTVTLNLAWSAKAQQAALMMDANNQLDHTPPATWLCHSADGAEAAGKSNLATDPALGGSFGAIDLYMGDQGVDSLGHRRWILYPPQAQMGTGDTAGMNALWVIGGNGTRPATPNGVAWPPAGHVPYALAPSNMAWSWSMNGANFANATVAVRAAGGVDVALRVWKPGNGYGDNTIAFAPSSGRWTTAAPADSSFDVTISGVAVGGATREFSYRVTLISPQ